MISRLGCERLLAVALIFCHSVGVCNNPEDGLSVGSPKLPSTVVFSEKPLEKVVYDAGPNQTLTGSVVLAVGQMSRPEVARAAGRAISKKMFISGLRKLYGVAPRDELVLEGLSVGRESFEGGVYGGNYIIPLAGVKTVKSVSSAPTRTAVVDKSPSVVPETAAVTPTDSKLIPAKKPNWEVDPRVLESSNLQSKPSALLRADERLQHEFECCSLAVDGVLTLMRSDAGFSYEAAASDLKTLTESFKSKVNAEMLFSKQEKLSFCKRIDALAEYGFQTVVELIK
jgi:hypothetical protein